MIIRLQKDSFFADNFDADQIFQSLNHVEINLKPQFLIRSGYYIVPNPSTTLRFTFEALSLLVILTVLLQ